MTRHGTALRVTPSIEREFHSAVIAQLPDFTDEEMQGYNRNKKELGRRLREALSPNGKESTSTDSFRDILPEGWEVVENSEEDPVSISELELVSFLRPGESYIPGKEMRRRAKGMGAAPGLRQARYLLDHQAEIPAEWRKYYLPLAGALVRAPDGRLFVPYLYWHGGGWGLDFRWLEDGWVSYARLVRRPSTRA